MKTYRFGTPKDKWVFIDYIAIEPGYGTMWKGQLSDGFAMPQGIRIAVHKPQLDPAPVLSPTPQSPLEAYGIGDASFLHDNGLFRCWYTSMSPSGNPRWPVAMRSHYAESNDGINWRKPILNLKEHHGSAQNNLVAGPAGRVFIDPSAPPSQRYKMVAPGNNNHQSPYGGVLGATSPDGLSFTLLPKPILPANNNDTANTCWFNPVTNRYCLYTRQVDGDAQRRGINRSESADFTCFPPSQPVIESNPLDPPDWDYYYNGFTPWPGASNAHIMQMAIFRHNTDGVDAHLATSRDEILWHRPLGTTPWLSGDHLTPSFPQLYPCGGLLPTAPGVWSLYFHADSYGHNELETRLDNYQPYLVRATLREDGFTSLSAEAHGQFWTIPFTLQSDQINLNFRTRYSGHIKCEIIDTSAPGAVGGTGTSVSRGSPAPGFTLADSDPLSGDHITHPLTWRGNPSLAPLKGKSIQLKFTLFKADIFALKF